MLRMLAHDSQHSRRLAVIDLTTETPVPLAAAAKWVPPGRNAKRTHLSTLLRWILDGATAPDGSRVRLEAVRLGGRWMTTREALSRFATALTPRLDTVDMKSPQVRTATSRQRASDRAAAELEKLGI
jgi:hypothetical protein